jgi:hypothetical protein
MVREVGGAVCAGQGQEVGGEFGCKNEAGC